MVERRISRRMMMAGTGFGIALIPLLHACRTQHVASEPQVQAREPQVQTSLTTAQAHLQAIERSLGGRLGVAALDTARGTVLEHRADERFPLCSTFKLVLAAAVLARVDRGEERLDRLLAYGEADLLDHAPVCREHVQQGQLSVGELSAASVGQSDNTAANLLLNTVGGPAGVTAFLRSLGDQVTRLDRTEPTLNLASDPLDTTTPAAMLRSMRTLLVGTTLSAASRQQLADWLVASTTGATKIRAGIPPTWKAGDKTGTCDRGTINDLAILWPPFEGAPRPRAPILIAAYSVGSETNPEVRNAALAEVGRVVAAAFE
jgi:beta-lactamase class A